MTDQQHAENLLLAELRAAGSEADKRRLLGQVLGPYLDQISRWALRTCRSPEDAADAAQDALLAICTHIDQFRGGCRFSTWIYTIVRNQGLRRAMRRPRGLEVPLDAASELEAPAVAPEDSLDRQSRVDRFRKLVSTELTPLESRIFLLHFGDGVPLDVLDRELGLTNPSGARAYLVSAKRKMIRKLKRLEKEPRPLHKPNQHRLAPIKASKDE